MARFIYFVYEVFDIGDSNLEYLLETETESAYEAIQHCLDVERKATLISLDFAGTGKHFREFTPANHWESWSVFEEALNTHILATKIQLNIDISLDKAAEDLIVSALGI